MTGSMKRRGERAGRVAAGGGARAAGGASPATRRGPGGGRRLGGGRRIARDRRRAGRTLARRSQRDRRSLDILLRHSEASKVQTEPFGHFRVDIAVIAS